MKYICLTVLHFRAERWDHVEKRHPMIGVLFGVAHWSKTHKRHRQIQYLHQSDTQMVPQQANHQICGMNGIKHKNISAFLLKICALKVELDAKIMFRFLRTFDLNR